jgi:adenylate cyclase
MEKRVFVARERELVQLDGFLKQALTAKGLVCFVTGEAGSGKTALVNEFAHNAQEQYADLAVAVGQSDAQTGSGDAYLPFREVLGQLTGDVEAKLSQGAITEENARRLRKMLVLSCQALVEVGPDLIDVIVPGSGLAARTGAFVAEKAGWLEKLERLKGEKQGDKILGNSGVEQSHIFEQYANVLGKLSDKHPLLLVFDDLQWADTASIGLLFRLGRRIEGHRILLVGMYRPEEVAIGRAGERHPLEKVLAELKRYYGDIWVDLNQVDQVEGRHFVNAFIDTEPNHLKDKFRQKLFQHTGGHALFTIELLRTMQERGNLTRDEHGRWLETSALDWESLPKRVEGVIEERIGRLSMICARC